MVSPFLIEKSKNTLNWVLILEAKKLNFELLVGINTSYSSLILVESLRVLRTAVPFLFALSLIGIKKGITDDAFFILMSFLLFTCLHHPYQSLREQPRLH